MTWKQYKAKKERKGYNQARNLKQKRINYEELLLSLSDTDSHAIYVSLWLEQKLIERKELLVQKNFFLITYKYIFFTVKFHFQNLTVLLDLTDLLIERFQG